jgi:hypothetical protein
VRIWPRGISTIERCLQSAFDKWAFRDYIANARAMLSDLGVTMTSPLCFVGLTHTSRRSSRPYSCQHHDESRSKSPVRNDQTEHQAVRIERRMELYDRSQKSDTEVVIAYQVPNYGFRTPEAP